MEAPKVFVATNSGKRWTKEEEADLLKSLSKGGSFSDLATFFGRTPSALETRALMLAAKEVRIPEVPVEVIARRYRLSPEALQIQLNKDNKKASPPRNSVPSPTEFFSKTSLPTENGYKPWTEDEKDFLSDMLFKGKSYADISLILKRSPAAVEAKALGMAVQSVAGGLSPQEAAKMYGFTPEKIESRIQAKKTKKTRPERAYQPWTQNEEKNLLEFALARLSFEEMADSLLRSPKAVEARLIKLVAENLPRNLSIDAVCQKYGIDSWKMEKYLRVHPELAMKAPVPSSKDVSKLLPIILNEVEKGEVSNAELKELLLEIRDLLRVLVHKS